MRDIKDFAIPIENKVQYVAVKTAMQKKGQRFSPGASPDLVSNWSRNWHFVFIPERDIWVFSYRLPDRKEIIDLYNICKTRKDINLTGVTS